MKILILGGDGFIGSHLLHKHLERKDECIVVDIENLRTFKHSRKYKYIHKDLSKDADDLKHILKRHKPDFVYNCVAVATPSFYVKYPVETFDLDFKVNYENICLPLIKSKIPFIQFSTSEVYGKEWTEPHNEDTSNLVLGPTQKCRWIYASSKILLEQLILAHHCNCCIIRPQNFCGWDMDWLPDISTNVNRKWIPRLPACYLNALFSHSPLVVVEPGTQKRCYTHIDDGIEGILAVVDNWSKCKGEVLNVGNARNEVSIKDVAEKYLKTWYKLTRMSNEGIIFKTGEDYYGDGYEDCPRRLFCSKKMYNLTGWIANINLEDTISKTIELAIRNYKHEGVNLWHNELG